jgi:hypothetical protein
MRSTSGRAPTRLASSVITTGGVRVAEIRSAGIACGSCGSILPAEWVNEPRDQRSPCPKCRGTQRRTAIAKNATSVGTQRPRGRRLFAASLVLSATGVGLLAWWLLSDPRSWITLGTGVVAAFGGVAIGAKGRRMPLPDEKRDGQ